MHYYVSGSADTEQDSAETEQGTAREAAAQTVGRPRREPRLPARLAGPEWTHVGVST